MPNFIRSDRMKVMLVNGSPLKLPHPVEDVDL